MTAIIDNRTAVAVSLEASGGERGIGEVFVEHFSSQERLGRGIVACVAGLLFSAVTLAIPLLHFVLFPIGVLLTIGIAWSKFEARGNIVGGHGDCPVCGASVTFAKRNLHFPFLERCDSCSRDISVRES